MKLIRLLTVTISLLSTTYSLGDTNTCNKVLTEPISIILDRSIIQNAGLPFYLHKGEGPFDTTLAMNISYEPVLYLRKFLEQKLELKSKLKFLTSWNPTGEGHITTITPPEYYNILRPFVSSEKMEKIAVENRIQESDVKIFGLGRGKKEINGVMEQTFFLIVYSENLLKIRNEIYLEFVKNGGNPELWNPNSFYPHITIGYTSRDLHESDGILKDVEHSLDDRFQISIGHVTD